MICSMEKEDRVLVRHCSMNGNLVALSCQLMGSLKLDKLEVPGPFPRESSKVPRQFNELQKQGSNNSLRNMREKCTSSIMWLL